MPKISERLRLLMLVAKTQAEMARRLAGQGLGFGDLAVLYAISAAPEGKIRRTDLAEAVGLTASGVTRLLLPLEKIGVVKREAHERDGRASYVTLTKSGQRLFEDALGWAEEKCEDIFPENTAKAVAAAAELLKSIA